VIGFLSQGRSSNQNTPAARDFGNDAPVVRDDKDHWVYLRPGASKHNAPLGIVPEGTAVQILRQNGSWFLVQTGDGRTGYISGSRLFDKERSEYLIPR
jgi:uncharacterized protein YgiM (DUF1202 family)